MAERLLGDDVSSLSIAIGRKRARLYVGMTTVTRGTVDIGAAAV